MVNVLRRLQKATRSRGRSRVHLPQRNEAQVRPSDQLQPRLQQRSRVRGTPPWHAHGQNMRSHSPHNLRGSNLVVQQTMRNCDAIADNMAAYQKLYNALEGSFDGCELNYITRANKTEADELTNIGSTRGPIPPGVFLESISQRSIKTPAAATEAVEDGEDATDPAQVASASPSEGTNASPPDSPAPGELDGPAWAKPFLRFIIEGALSPDVAE